MRRLPLFFLLGVALQCYAHDHQTIQEQLGYPAEAKLLIIHADDLGVSHSENIATFQAMQEGIVTSASVMMPTPWAKEAVAYALQNPDADLGVHITLTAEWETYKWGPLLGADTAPSLVDEHGHFHPTVAAFVAEAKIEEVEAEVRAQIEAAKIAGIAFTHFDGHMGSMLASDEIAQLYFRLGKEYGVPVRLHEHHGKDSGSSTLREAVVQMPGKVTTIHGATPSDFPHGMAKSYNDYLRNLQPGLNLLVLHLGFDDAEMQAITVDHPNWGAQWRQADYDWSMSEEAKSIIKDEGIILVDWGLVKEKLFDPVHVDSTAKQGFALANANAALNPLPRHEKVWNNKGGETWTGRHEAIVAEAAKGEAELIFIGDSITHGWDTTGSGTDVWQQVYAPFQAINMGFGGDRIQHVLWRFENGELDGISPKVAVVMIGTNNWKSNTYKEIAEGVTVVCEQIRQRLPETKILLLGIFPRVSADPWAGANVLMANRLIEKLGDGKWIHYLDIGDSFRDSRGRLRFELMPDGLHPNATGYEVWAEAIRPKLSELMGVDIPSYSQ